MCYVEQVWVSGNGSDWVCCKSFAVKQLELCGIMGVCALLQRIGIFGYWLWNITLGLRIGAWRFAGRCRARTGDRFRSAAVTVLRLDADGIAWFQPQEQGYQTRINSALREYLGPIATGLGFRGSTSVAPRPQKRDLGHPISDLGHTPAPPLLCRHNAGTRTRILSKAEIHS